jgi:hypothetical protein
MDKRTKMPSNEKKVVTSLLLYSMIPSDALDAYLSRCADVTNGKQYGHEVPPITQNQRGTNDIKCTFDFTEQLRTDLGYHAALTDFMETHEQFICDVLSIDDRVRWALSALLNVDESLAVFEVKSPRLPKAINAFRTFEFDYFVWHPLKDGEEQSS